MIIYYGSSFFGKVDNVPGVFHVATKFGHIYYIPLVPSQSFLVLERTSSGIRGVPIPFSWKSMLAAWLRASFIVIAVISLVMLFALGQGRATTSDYVTASVTLAGAVGLLVWSYFMLRVGRASYERAIELADYADFTEEGKIAIGEALGKLSKEDAAAARRLLRGGAVAPAAARPRHQPALGTTASTARR
jgi:hypothetical protein